MLIAHVELEGVWQVDGGMHALAQALARLAEQQGALLPPPCHATGAACPR